MDIKDKKLNLYLILRMFNSKYNFILDLLLYKSYKN